MILKDRAIGFVTGNKFYSDQFNARFKDLISNKFVEPLDYEVIVNDDEVTITVYGGIFVDHRGIRYDFFSSYPLRTTFSHKKALETKLVRISLYYDKMIRNNTEMELRPYHIQELNSYSGTEDGEDLQQSNLITLYWNGKEYEKVGAPYVVGEEMRDAFDSLEGRVLNLEAATGVGEGGDLNAIMELVEANFETLDKLIAKTREDLEKMILEGLDADGALSDITDKLNRLEADFEDERRNAESQRRKMRVPMGVAKNGKDDNGVYTRVTRYDEEGKVMMVSELTEPDELGRYQKRVITYHIGTPFQNTQTLAITYDEDGEVRTEFKI